jgi:hypothetical protein
MVHWTLNKKFNFNFKFKSHLLQESADGAEPLVLKLVAVGQVVQCVGVGVGQVVDALSHGLLGCHVSLQSAQHVEELFDLKKKITL